MYPDLIKGIFSLKNDTFLLCTEAEIFNIIFIILQAIMFYSRTDSQTHWQLLLRSISCIGTVNIE